MITATDLETLVRNTVDNFLDSREPFTTADVSHPIIRDDNDVRHRDVREIIDRMYARGDMEEAAFVVSTITVWPQGGSTPRNVRLFHPDEPGFDTSSYTRTRQELVRNNVKQASADDSTDDSDDDDSVVSPSNTSSGDRIRRTCYVHVQHNRHCLNIPQTISVSAGFNAGDNFSVYAGLNETRIVKDAIGTQKVDAEGRIRVYPTGLNNIGKNCGDSCIVMEVEGQSGSVFIQVQ